MVEQNSLIEVFCCYSHKDADLLCELKTHLSPLERLNIIKIWDDGEISAGTEWGPEIKKHLNNAKIILLLISPSFINSDYCYGTEMQHALERHKQREARVIPIILRHISGWQRIPPGDIQLGNLQVLPKDAKPVRSWTDRDEAWKGIVEGIEGAVSELLMREPIPPAQESQDSYILSRIWSKLSPDLREVLVSAFNASRQEASNGPIQTRHVFAALQSTPNTAKPLLAELPQEVLPRSGTSERALKERDLMDVEPSLSDCVEESLREREKYLRENEEITAFDLLVQLLRTGTGSTVSRLHRAGITPDRVDDLVRSLSDEEV